MHAKAKNLKLKEKSEVVTSVTHTSQRSYKPSPAQPVKYLNIDYFKISPCGNTQQHLHKRCINYHNEKDRRRYGNFYSTNLCERVLKGSKCSNGDECKDAHSRVQVLYQHDNYKKKFCTHYPKSVQKCEYGDFCAYAHSEEEIRTQLIHNYEFDEDFYMFHYKTQFCPFNLTEHEKGRCVYAHNLQDYRRSPSFYYYEPIACFNWKTGDDIYEYEVGCEKGLACGMCHGWKQLDYHPKFYRVNKCLKVNCRSGQCPNYHSRNQQRIIESNVASNFFRLVPRNRVVEGVFKPYNESSFVAKTGIAKTHSTVSQRKKEWVETDFASLTTLKSRHQSPPQKKQSELPDYLLDQSPAESDQSNASNSEVENQIDLVMGEE